MQSNQKQISKKSYKKLRKLIHSKTIMHTSKKKQRKQIPFFIGLCVCVREHRTVWTTIKKRWNSHYWRVCSILAALNDEKSPGTQPIFFWSVYMCVRVSPWEEPHLLFPSLGSVSQSFASGWWRMRTSCVKVKNNHVSRIHIKSTNIFWLFIYKIWGSILFFFSIPATPPV